MRSKARIKDHPLHPILVAFPIAFLSATVFFDIIAFVFDLPSWYKIASVLNAAGLVTGALAAIPGAIDYLFVIPPKSSAKKRATLHLIVNATGLTLFFIAWLMRDDIIPTTATYILEIAGLCAMGVGGWLGGTLVYRNQIGVDHRYANAGKWREEYISNHQTRVRVAGYNELSLNQMKLLHIGQERIVLAKTEAGHVAFQDKCTHRGGPLSDGVHICGTVACPWHGSQFDTKTGHVKAGPAEHRIHVYQVVEDGEGVWLLLESEDAGVAEHTPVESMWDTTRSGAPL